MQTAPSGTVAVWLPGGRLRHETVLSSGVREAARGIAEQRHDPGGTPPARCQIGGVEHPDIARGLPAVMSTGRRRGQRRWRIRALLARARWYGARLHRAAKTIRLSSPTSSVRYVTLARRRWYCQSWLTLRCARRQCHRLRPPARKPRAKRPPAPTLKIGASSVFWRWHRAVTSAGEHLALSNVTEEVWADGAGRDRHAASSARPVSGNARTMRSP